MLPPQNPSGEYVPEPRISAERRAALIAEVAETPAAMKAAVAGLTEAQLDTKYRNWTIRQIVHHLPDSHVNCYVRFKWTLTEETPTIKPYDETRWSDLADSRTGDISIPLGLLTAIHASWVQLLRKMTPEQFTRAFHHPETGQTRSLDEILGLYAWHGRHHIAQINWRRKQEGW